MSNRTPSECAFSGEEEEALNPEAEKLVDRCMVLLEEVEAFQRSLRRNKLDKGVELRHFVGSVKSELRFLQGLTFSPPSSEKVHHTIRSSNLSYLESVWLAAKSTTDIIALTKPFHLTSEDPLLPSGRRNRQKSTVSVDVVAQNGLQWIKVSTISERRLLFEIAKAGWEEGGESGDEFDDNYSSSDETTVYQSEASYSTVPTSCSSGPSETGNSISKPRPIPLALSNLAILKQACQLYTASLQTRVQYLHPNITIHLSNISPPVPENHVLREFLIALHSTGVSISLGRTYLPLPASLSLPTPTSTDPPEEPQLSILLSTISTAPTRRYATFSNPINIDTTILLALVSDITHQPIPVEPRFHPSILRQLESEKESAMLPEILLPAIGEREMVCTPMARERFLEIVGIVGSESEKRRTRLILDDLPPTTPKKKVKKQSLHAIMHPHEAGEDEEEEEREEDGDGWGEGGQKKKPQGPTPQERLQSLQTLSTHPLPQTFRLPIRTLESEKAFTEGSDDDEKTGYASVSSKLSVVNRAVFVTGWKKGYTTITSNRTVAKLIEGLVQEGVKGPDVFVIGTARSLIGTARRIEDH